MAEPHVVTVHIEDDANFIALMDQWQRERRAIRDVVCFWQRAAVTGYRTTGENVDSWTGDYRAIRNMAEAFKTYEAIRSEDVGQH